LGRKVNGLRLRRLDIPVERTLSLEVVEKIGLYV